MKLILIIIILIINTVFSVNVETDMSARDVFILLSLFEVAAAILWKQQSKINRTGY